MTKKNRRKLSRRQFLGGTAAVAVTAVAGTGPAAVVVSAQGAAQGARRGIAPGTDLRFVNGRIHTMDARNSIANAVSIRNGRFLAVGNTVPAPGPDSRTIDLKGRTVVPGIIEGHIHSVSLANRPGYHTILE